MQTQKFWCLECDSTFYDEHKCPYCGERNFDIADDDEYPCAITDPYETSGPNSVDAKAEMPCRRIEFDFTDCDDSGAQLHQVEPDYDAVFAAIERAIEADLAVAP